MKLNKKSWHCKLYKWAFCTTDKYLPANLCNYFWSVMLATVTLPLTAVSVFVNNIDMFGTRVFLSVLLYICSFVVWFIGFILLRLTCDPTFSSKHTVFEDYSHNWIAYAALPVGVALTWLVMYAVKLVCDWSDNLSYREKAKVKKQPNIVVEYLKAKKEKACPFIDWE